MTSAFRSFFVVVASLVLAIEVGASSSPQPRVKLQRDAGGTATAVPDKPVTAADSTTVLDKITVTESKVPARPRPLQEYTGKSFSIRNGGPFSERSGKRFSVSFGLWHHQDEFAEDSRFKPAATHASFDLLRIKW